jgi:hypothetical protein
MGLLADGRRRREPQTITRPVPALIRPAQTTTSGTLTRPWGGRGLRAFPGLGQERVHDVREGHVAVPGPRGCNPESDGSRSPSGAAGRAALASMRIPRAARLPAASTSAPSVAVCCCTQAAILGRVEPLSMRAAAESVPVADVLASGLSCLSWLCRRGHCSALAADLRRAGHVEGWHGRSRWPRLAVSTLALALGVAPPVARGATPGRQGLLRLQGPTGRRRRAERAADAGRLPRRHRPSWDAAGAALPTHNRRARIPVWDAGAFRAFTRPLGRTSTSIGLRRGGSESPHPWRRGLGRLSGRPSPPESTPGPQAPRSRQGWPLRR